MTDTKKKHAQGHWILAKMGKRVLRPGGLALTQSMIKSLHITTEDHVVELAPGLGLTAQEIVKKQPKSYTGIELDADAIRKLKKKLNNPIVTLTQANATTTGIHTNSATKVFGEAMLSMQNDHQKSKIIKEAHRILRPGGLYSIHELGLQPNTLASGIKVHIQSELAKAIKVNARPLTQREWCDVLTSHGFRIVSIDTSPMNLLQLTRILKDEGVFRTLKIIVNLLTHPYHRKRVLQMRKVFCTHKQYLMGIRITAQKLKDG